jgi:hypothetical protein
MQNWAQTGAQSNTTIAQRWINRDTASPEYPVSGGFNIGTFRPISYVTFDGYDHGPPDFTSDAIFQNWAKTFQYAGVANPNGIRNVARFAFDNGCSFGIQEWAPGVQRSDAGPPIPSEDKNYVYYIRGMHGCFEEFAAVDWANGRQFFEIFFNNTTKILCHNINPRNGATNENSAEYGGLIKPSDEYVDLWTP